MCGYWAGQQDLGPVHIAGLMIHGAISFFGQYENQIVTLSHSIGGWGTYQIPEPQGSALVTTAFAYASVSPTGFRETKSP